MSAPKMKELLFQALEAFPVTCEFYALDAKQKRVQFLSLVREGFTEAQAIELLRPRA